MQSRTCLHRTLTRTDLERVFGLDDLSTADAFNGNLTLRNDGVWRSEFGKPSARAGTWPRA